jgi:hypothetical protein
MDRGLLTCSDLWGRHVQVSSAQGSQLVIPDPAEALPLSTAPTAQRGRRDRSKPVWGQKPPDSLVSPHRQSCPVRRQLTDHQS